LGEANALVSSNNLPQSLGAESLLQELETHGDEAKRKLYQLCREDGPGSHPLRFDTPPLTTSALLDRVQDKPDVEASLRQLKKRRINERGNVVYIPPQAKANMQASDESRFPLMDKVNEFLKSDQTVLLLLGDSGAGKSMFNRTLECELWQGYTKKIGVIPLYINLPSIDKPDQDLVAKQLRKLDFTESQIRELKYRQFILICDGYDESQQTRNLYTSNQLNEEGEWTAKMVISCRSEYVGRDYRDRFEPGDRNRRPGQRSLLFQEAVIAPFSTDQVQDYIRQYVALCQPLWESENYLQALNLIPGLMDLVKNPFLLTMSLDVLPRMMDPGEHISAAHITKVALYDQFVEQWLERGKKRIGEKNLSFQGRSAFDSLCDEGFTMNGIDYLKKLSVAIYKEQDGQPVVEYSRFNDEGTWKAVFFSRNEEKQLLREACPLVRSSNQFRFIHRSLLEYGLARAIFEPQDHVEATTSGRAISRRGSMSSAWSFEIEGGLTEATLSTGEQLSLDAHSPLVWKNLVNEPSVIQFLSERVLQQPIFKHQLLAYIEHSKTDKIWRRAAANAITVLVRAEVPFVGADLQGIQIPGADLGYGVFDSAQLQHADLRKVNFRGAWLRQTNLNRAQMTGARFGELPFLTEETQVYSCAYSPDAETLAVGLRNGDINLYTTSNWEKILTLSGHTNTVRCIAYSSNGDQIASCSEDITVRIWDSETGSLLHTLTDHSDWIRCVAYSPHGDQLASASDDMTALLWDAATGDCCQMLLGHTSYVYSAAYSPNGEQIASGSEDSTVRLWDVETGDCSHTLVGHNLPVSAVAYSPRGDQLVSASEDTTIRLWNVEVGVCSHTLSGHANMVLSIAYSPKGDQLVSGGEDGTVRLWDIDAGHCLQILTGHNNAAFSVAYSPKGDQIASGSSDTTVRLWDISAEPSRFVSSGHSKEVCSVKCSPKGGLVASGSFDDTIRLWDVDTGACRHIIRNHGDMVLTIAFSPQGDRIASGSSDYKVRLWDVKAGTCLHALDGHSSWVRCVAFSPHGDMLASASDDKTVLLWDVETGERREILEGHTDGVLSVVFSPDASKIATSSQDCTVRIWDVDTWTCSHILVGHIGRVADVVYSPQGNQLASAGYDTIIQLWDVEAGECSMTLTGHNDRVRTIDYSKQGDLLASGSWDGIVRLWDVTTGQCRAEIQHIPGSLLSIAWSTDGTFLVTGSKDGSVLRWDVTEEGGVYSTRLRWLATNGTLAVTGAFIQDARGLTGVNKQLLKQRGAIGEPENLLRVTSKRLTTMASVVSQLKESSGGMTQDKWSSNLSIEQPGQYPDTDQH